MKQFRWVNPHQPQTLYMATILCYLDAALGLLGAGGYPLMLLLAVGLGVGGFGVANDKKWGYGVAVAAAAVQVLLLVLVFGASVFGFPAILDFAFDVALVALLVHPMSRDYQRIWFS